MLCRQDVHWMTADQGLAAAEGAAVGSMTQNMLRGSLTWADPADVLRALMGEGLLLPDEFRAVSAVFRQEERKQAQQQGMYCSPYTKALRYALSGDPAIMLV